MKRLPIIPIYLISLFLVLATAEVAHALPGDPSLGDDYTDLCSVTNTDEPGTEDADDTDAEAAPPCTDPFADTKALPPSALELRAAETGSPDPFAVLPIRPSDVRVEEAALGFYARVVNGDVPIFDAPGGSIIGTTGNGFVFYTTNGSSEANGELWTNVGAGQWIRQNDLRWRTPSAFAGVYIDGQPEREFAWMLDPNQPLLSPGGPPNKHADFLERYQIVTIYATVWVGDWRYYMIAPDQWVYERWLGKAIIQPPPEDVSGQWVDIDLYEQTLVAYEDARPVYATLIASGLEEWSTTEGVFQIYYKVPNGPMSGAEGEEDFYYLQSVPWSMYFHEGEAIHGAYWHDGFGYRRSHGCVNVAPADAMWLFNWAEEGTWVHVHSSSEYQ